MTAWRAGTTLRAERAQASVMTRARELSAAADASR